MAFLDEATWRGKVYSGGWVAASGEAAVTEPATGNELGRTGIAGPADIARAAGQAQAAQSAWAATPYTQRAAILRKAAEQSANFRAALIRHEQALFAQAQQSAACNASHTVEARLSRWLLRSRELAGSNALGLTQEFVAQMLGVRRTSVSLVANTLQSAGLIRYSRGRVQIANLDGLRAASCECYGRVKAQYDRLLDSKTSSL